MMLDELRAKAICGIDGIDRVPLADAEAALAECERKLVGAREALQAYRNFKPFDWRFDHSGAMNATQLGEHDVYVKIRARADKALAALTEAGEQEKKR